MKFPCEYVHAAVEPSTGTVEQIVHANCRPFARIFKAASVIYTEKTV